MGSIDHLVAQVREEARKEVIAALMAALGRPSKAARPAKKKPRKKTRRKPRKVRPAKSPKLVLIDVPPVTEQAATAKKQRRCGNCGELGRRADTHGCQKTAQVDPGPKGRTNP